MDITLLYFEDCPNWKVADERLRVVASERGDVRLTRHLVETPAEAERTGFHGSPSIQVDGVDVFAEPDSEVGWPAAATAHRTDSKAHRPSSSYGRSWPMRDRVTTIGPIAAMAGAIGLCCALPVLLSLGIAGAIAGWSLQSWVLIGLGLVLAGTEWARWVRDRGRDRPTHRPRPTAHADTPPAKDTDSPTDGTAKENTV